MRARTGDGRAAIRRYQAKVSLLPESVCGVCDMSFQATRGRKYCSERCRKTRSASRRKALNPPPAKNSGVSGAASELIVCADLLRRGYDVFRAVAASCPCDLMAIRGSQQLRVEVTTGLVKQDGGLTYPRKNKEKHDVLAVVLRGSFRIIYSPDLDAVEHVES